MSPYEMVPVKSHNLHSVGYDPITKEMTVRFLRTDKATKERVGGASYKYANVEPSQHEAFMQVHHDIVANNKEGGLSAHFNEHFKKHPDKHPFTRLPD